MLIFKCDRCGKEIARDEAWNISMVPEDYAAEEERRKLHAELKVQGELCRDCAEIILGEMIYLKEVPARDCHGAERLAMTEGEVPARDCHGAERLAMTEGEVLAEKRQGCREVQGTVEGKAHQGCRALQNGNAQMQEGRCITVARKRAGLTMEQVADKLYVSKNCLGNWERGMIQKIPWDDIETVLPEVKEIREKGCEAFCPSPKACLGGGKCYYSGKKV